MRAAELRGKRVAVWGYGREGRGAVQLLRSLCPGLDLAVLDDAAPPFGDPGVPFVSGRAAVAEAIGGFDIVVKSPGISLYDPLAEAARAQGVRFTSLLNLWFAAGPSARTICVTGTKGKSTTASLLAHLLRGLGRSAALAGNIGVPVSDIPLDGPLSAPPAGPEFAVIEVSSYQAADFAETCDVAVLTSLSQEHIDWHRSVEAYRRDKLNLLRHARRCAVNAEALAEIGGALDLGALDRILFNTPATLHQQDGAVRLGDRKIGPIDNPYLARRHNASNLCAALAALSLCGIDPGAALPHAAGFQPLDHRQQEIGEIGGILFVDDSISTTPEAALAALDAYRGRPVTAILGGFDRGIDYRALVERLNAGAAGAVILLGEAGRRIRRGLAGPAAHAAGSMAEAVALAKRVTPAGGVVLLSPAAPSYDAYQSFIERGRDFARCAGVTS